MELKSQQNDKKTRSRAKRYWSSIQVMSRIYSQLTSCSFVREKQKKIVKAVIAKEFDLLLIRAGQLACID